MSRAIVSGLPEANVLNTIRDINSLYDHFLYVHEAVYCTRTNVQCNHLPVKKRILCPFCMANVIAAGGV